MKHDDDPRSWEQFPMWVMHLDDVLKISGTLEPHQSYLARGLLRKWTPEMFCVFVSHEWCDRSHPDPELAQLGVFQQVFGPEGLVAGRPSEIGLSLGQTIGRDIDESAMPNVRPMLQAQHGNIFVWLDFVGTKRLDPSTGGLLRHALRRSLKPRGRWIASRLVGLRTADEPRRIVC